MEMIHTILTIQSWSSAYILNSIPVCKSLFGVSFIYVIEFFGKIVLLFAASAIISKLLKLDKASVNTQDHENA